MRFGQRGPWSIRLAAALASIGTIGEGRFALAQDDPGVAIDDRASEAVGRKLDPEGMGSATSALTRFASLVLPVIFSKEGNIDPPDDDRTSALDDFRGVDQVSPDDVPAGVVLV